MTMTRPSLPTAILLSLSLVASIATSPAPPEFEYRSEGASFTLDLSPEVPDAGMTVLFTSSQKMWNSEDVYWSMSAALTLTNTADSSGELAMWQLTSPWEGGELPEDAFLLDTVVINKQIGERPRRETTYLYSSIDDLDAPFYLVFTLDGEAILQGEGEMSVFGYSDNSQIPDEGSLTLELQ